MEAHERLLHRLVLSTATKSISKMAQCEDRYSSNDRDRDVLVRQRVSTSTRTSLPYATMRNVQCSRSTTRPARSSRVLSAWTMLTTASVVVLLLLSLSSKTHAVSSSVSSRYSRKRRKFNRKHHLVYVVQAIASSVVF